MGKNDGLDFICAHTHALDLFVDGCARILPAVVVEFLRDLCAAHPGVHQDFVTIPFKQPGENRVVEDGP